MRIVITSDVHIGHYARFDRNGSRLERCLKGFEAAVAYAQEHNLLHVDAGDLLEDKNMYDATVHNALYDLLTKYQTNTNNTVALVGNHNFVTTTGSQNNLHGLQHRMLVVSTPFMVRYEDVILAFIPYQTSIEKWKAAYADVTRDLSNNGKAILFGHQEITGAVTGTHRYVAKDGVDPSLLPGPFDLALFGHYHKRQQVADRTWYIGALMQQAFDEEGNQQGFYVLDTDTMDMEFMPISTEKFVTVSSVEEAKAATNSFVRIVSDQPRQEVIDEIPEVQRSNVAVIPAPPKTQPRLNLGNITTVDDAIEAYIEDRVPPERRLIVRQVLHDMQEGTDA
jgi:exonuclease SbcD